MKYLIRVLALPFVFGLIMIRFTYGACQVCWQFLKHGGEISSYEPNDNVTMKQIYMELKEQRQLTSE